MATGADPRHDAGLLRQHLARLLPLIQEGMLRGLHNGLRHLLRDRNHTTSGRRMSLSALQHTCVPERRVFWHAGPLWNSGRLFLCPKPGERHGAKTSRVREHGLPRSVKPATQRLVHVQHAAAGDPHY